MVARSSCPVSPLPPGAAALPFSPTLLHAARSDVMEALPSFPSSVPQKQQKHKVTWQVTLRKQGRLDKYKEVMSI